MKKLVSILLLAALMLSLAACGGSGSSNNQKASGSDVEKLVSDYGYQWTDPNAPIVNDKGAQEISFTIYSSKNASAIDYNDMKIMQDLYDSTTYTVVLSDRSCRVFMSL